MLLSASCLLLLCVQIFLIGNYLSSYSQTYQFHLNGPTELALDRGKIWLFRYSDTDAGSDDDEHEASDPSKVIPDSDRRWLGFASAQGMLGNGVGFHAFAVPHWAPLLLMFCAFVLLLRRLRKPQKHDEPQPPRH